VFEISPPHSNLIRGRGEILHKERRKKINKCNNKNPPFSNPRIDNDTL
jgi:hypothetical protein